jgi:hypothetical protein
MSSSEGRNLPRRLSASRAAVNPATPVFTRAPARRRDTPPGTAAEGERPLARSLAPLLDHTAPLRVLVAEADRATRERLRELLSSAPDLIVSDLAADGPQAVASLALRRPDFALVALDLPEVAGADPGERAVAARAGPVRAPAPLGPGQPRRHPGAGLRGGGRDLDRPQERTAPADQPQLPRKAGGGATGRIEDLRGRSHLPSLDDGARNGHPAGSGRVWRAMGKEVTS